MVCTPLKHLSATSVENWLDTFQTSPQIREEHSMDQYRSRPKISENFERHWSIPCPGEIHMDQSLVHTFSWGNSYGPMVLKVLQKFSPTLVLVHGWLFPVRCPNRKIEIAAISNLGNVLDSKWGLSKWGAEGTCPRLPTMVVIL